MVSTSFASVGLRKAVGEGQIRLLKLLPGSRDVPIHCEIENVALAECPFYEALSYVWGDSNKRTSIVLQGHNFEITSNLFDALCQLRLPTKTRTLWIDAICIDQTSTLEKNHQIRLMWSIYEHADCVLIFLGGPSLKFEANGLCLVPQLLRAMEQAREKKMKLRPEYLDSRDLGAENLDCQDIKPHLEKLKTVGLPSPMPFPYIYEAFGELLSRPWFQRIWVLQEIAASKSAKVICGEQCVSWDEFINAIMVCKAFGLMPILTNPVNTLWPQLIAGLRRDITRGRQLNLLELLVAFRHCNATDARDKIYALCGLVAQEIPNVVPDYRLGLLKLYRTVAATMIQRQDGLDLLHVPQSPRSPTMQSLPSWCPDWSNGYVFCEPLLNLRRIESTTTRYTFNASDRSLPFVAIDAGLTILTLKGILFDEVANVTEPLYESWLSQVNETEPKSGKSVPLSEAELLHCVQLQMQQKAEASLKEQKRFTEWEKMADLHSQISYPTNENHVDVFRKTLTANHAPNGEYAQKKAFQKWLSNKDVDEFTKGCESTTLQSAVMKAISATSRLIGKRHSSNFPINALPAIGRRLARTRKGYLALVPDTAQAGSGIWLVKGAKTPLILERLLPMCPGLEDVYHVLTGAAYVHGIMYGEAFDNKSCELVKLR